jgi:hypothetical protein
MHAAWVAVCSREGTTVIDSGVCLTYTTALLYLQQPLVPCVLHTQCTTFPGSALVNSKACCTAAAALAVSIHPSHAQSS